MHAEENDCYPEIGDIPTCRYSSSMYIYPDTKFQRILLAAERTDFEINELRMGHSVSVHRDPGIQYRKTCAQKQL
jgi:hypothetical protein